MNRTTWKSLALNLTRAVAAFAVLAAVPRTAGQEINAQVRVQVQALDKALKGASRSENDYRAGQRELDQRDYENAVSRFDRVIESKGERADGAMYWKAYALNKLGRRDPALAALAELEKQFPQSRWLNDARALAVEIRAATGGAVPESQTDEELKLLAINGLIHQEPERALPLLEKILGDARNPPSLKSRALYVLAQSRAPRAREIVTQYARGGSNPDLQIRAVEYLGTVRTPEASQTLFDVYNATSDPAVRREAVRALSRQRAVRQLVDLARKETGADMKRELVRVLAGMRDKEAADYLVELLSK
jgi:HEAT repeat protein